MPSTTNVLDEARDLLTRRLQELDQERKRIERALSEMGDRVGGRRRGRPRGGSKKASRRTGATKKTRRRRRGGTRADQAVKLV
jgi:hypothetical protein